MGPRLTRKRRSSPLTRPNRVNLPIPTVRTESVQRRDGVPEPGLSGSRLSVVGGAAVIGSIFWLGRIKSEPSKAPPSIAEARGQPKVQPRGIPSVATSQRRRGGRSERRRAAGRKQGRRSRRANNQPDRSRLTRKSAALSRFGARSDWRGATDGPNRPDAVRHGAGQYARASGAGRRRSTPAPANPPAPAAPVAAPAPAASQSLTPRPRPPFRFHPPRPRPRR